VHQVGNQKCSSLFGCPNLQKKDPSLFSSTEQQKVIRQNIRTNLKGPNLGGDCGGGMMRCS
jgi:hypothetical protein